MPETNQIYRLWKPISFTTQWKECDTSVLDDISDSWFRRRLVLRESSKEYARFLNQLKREHAIETGIIERLYDLKQGITETFIKEGFVKSYLSHGDTNIPEDELMAHLNDHLDAVNFVFDVVKENRPLTTDFIKELHHLVTRHQKHAEGRDQFGYKLKIPLLKGTYKVRENNPTRKDGTIIRYCPPEQVASEMDNLVRIFNQLVEEEEHPLVIASWFHHAFVTIHPFQDGNGRVARLLASLIFIKFGYFPFTVLRQEAKVKYIEALELADKGQPQKLVAYFGEVQKKNIQKALNIKEVAVTSLAEVQDIFVKKIEQWQEEKKKEHQVLLEQNRKMVFEYCFDVLKELKNNMKQRLNGHVQIEIKYASFEEEEKQDVYFQRIVQYAKDNDYFFNRALPKAWLTYEIILSENKKYSLGILIHHYGYDDTTLGIGAILQFDSQNGKNIHIDLPLDLPPHVIAINKKIEQKTKNIKSYLETALTATLAQIASEL